MNSLGKGIMFMNEERLQKQIEFLIEADKLKEIYRNTLLIDNSRRETVAEHSWHLALAAIFFSEYSSIEINLEKVIKMSLIHDLVEIYIGDTSAFEQNDDQQTKLKEQAAADIIFNILPEDQKLEFHSLWLEFNENQTSEAQFANSIDRLQPFINEYYSEKSYHPSKEAMKKRMIVLKDIVPILWAFVEKIIDKEK